MSIYELFSRRKKKAEQTEPDPYRYDDIPEPLRNQIMFIWRDAIGAWHTPSAFGGSHEPPHNNQAWIFIQRTICREKGIVSLAGYEEAFEDCNHYLLQAEDIDDLLDIIEVSFRQIDGVTRNYNSHHRRMRGIRQEAQDAIDELNHRFREASVGYQFEAGSIVRVDSQLVHSEVVLPAFRLLSDPSFAGPEEEFRSAHAHYRAGEYKDCVTDALNAFESTMKAICDAKGWAYNRGARASDLIRVLRDNDLLPDYLDRSFDQLIATLTSGLPQVRNEEGAHGQGAQPKDTPAYMAAYALHLAAAKIVLLVEAYKDGA